MANIYDSSGSVVNSVYNINGNQLLAYYDINGNLLKSHAVSSTFTKTQMTTPSLGTGTQGFACDSVTQSIAQFYTEHIYMIDLAEVTVTHLAQVSLGHGHTGQFAPTKTSSQDYPYLYVSGGATTINDTLYAYLLEFICTTSSATLNKIYAVPVTTGLTGTSQMCIDFDNRIIYHVTASTYYDDADYTYINAWSMDDTETLSNATYSPTPTEGIYALTNQLSAFSVPFIKEMQACTFFDGMVVAISDVSSSKKAYFVDVETESVYLTLNNIGLSGELEGVGFLYNDETEQYDMVISDREGSGEYSTVFYRYEFI